MKGIVLLKMCFFSNNSRRTSVDNLIQYGVQGRDRRREVMATRLQKFQVDKQETLSILFCIAC